ncbi:CadC family transcriptional regulator [Shewanella sairae]|uniref:CadC family transcriptional regulator n=1 Tax=Shewanella sairae TaxID=190310 RepID=A0ABQ4P020_9GAMM|nr:helix-turn-helix domain-containing protein [Shewanella sairae]MCL1128405.1 CadC family transcriptional regulator [Shewanella sairae]GIU40792.1 CadC family transcriptional regulator [Shewanella sairae]
MYIGPYRFDLELRELVHTRTESAPSFKLSDIEYLVLHQLMMARGQVVSIDSMCADLLPQVVSYQDIATAVQSIKRFLGAEYAMLIEDVAKQGYMLHVKAKDKPMLACSLSAISIKNYVLCLILGVLLIIFLATNLKTTSDISLSIPYKLHIKDSGSVLVPIYAADADKAKYKARVEQLALKLARCEKLKWQRIYVAPSSNGNKVDFLMNDIADDGKACNNLKVRNVEDNWNFIDVTWLKEAGFCE